MSDIKLPRPIEDYLIGKYDNGVCCYLITKEAYRNWKAVITVKHLCIKKDTGLDLPVYSLAYNAKYKAFEFSKIPLDWQPIISKDYPELAKQLCEYYSPKPAVKSEPTPDEYYIIYRAESDTYHTGLRKDINTLTGSASLNGPKWIDPKTSWNHTIFYLKEQKHKLSWYKKFPQLSSEVKAELQKLNPGRYKEWEDFYMKKYPTFKALNGPKVYDTIDPGSVTIVSYGNNCLYFPDTKEYEDSKKEMYCYFLSKMHSKDGLKKKFAVVSTKEYEGKNSHQSFTFKTLPVNLVKLFKELNLDLYKQFEQYYFELEWKKAVAEKQSPNLNFKGMLSNYTYDMHRKTPDMFYLYTVGSGWELARREAIKGINCIPAPDSKVMLIKVSDYSVREVDHKYITQWAPVKFEQLSKGEQLNNFQKQNPLLYGQWMHVMQYGKLQQGSDLDIDQKVIADNYKKQLLAIGYGSKPDLRGEWSIFNSPQSVSPGLHMGTPYYSMGWDPYQSNTKTQGVISVWGKDMHGKLVNRLIELEVEKDYDQILEYWKQHARVAEQMALCAQNQQFYTPNLKQQNHEINVPRKTITVTVGKRYSGSVISSYQCPPAVTVGHTEHQHQPCRGKEISGGCKIG